MALTSLIYLNDCLMLAVIWLLLIGDLHQEEAGELEQRVLLRNMWVGVLVRRAAEGPHQEFPWPGGGCQLGSRDSSDCTQSCPSP